MVTPLSGFAANLKIENMIQHKKIKHLPIEIIDGDRSRRYPKRSEFQETGILFLNTANIVQNRLDLTEANFISLEKFNEIRKGRLQEFDIVITTRGSIGKVALFNLTPPTGIINAQMLILRADSKVIDPKFLFYQLCDNRFQTKLKNFASGAAQPQIPMMDLKEIEIMVPPLPTQRKIAAVLSTYDDLIENNTRRIKILEDMAQTLYQEWFVHFRFPGHENVPMVESPLGPIPQGWEVKQLGEMCHVLMGLSPKSEFYNETGEGLPFHQGVTNFGQRFPTDRVYCTIQKRIAEVGDILFSVRAPVGRINVANKKIVIGRGLSAIRSKSGDQAFILQQLKDRFEEEDTIGSGTIYNAITKTDLLGIQLLKPVKSIVAKFEEAAQPISLELANLTMKNANLRQTRDILLPKLISGEIDVSELDIDTAPKSRAI